MNDLGLTLGGGIDAGDDYGLFWVTGANEVLGTSDTFGFQDLGVLPSDGSTISATATRVSPRMPSCRASLMRHSGCFSLRFRNTAPPQGASPSN